MSALSDGSDATILRFNMGALELIREPEALCKFTSSLPMTVRHVHDHNSGNPTTLRAAVQKFLGEPDVECTKRRVPAVSVVSLSPVVFGDHDQDATFRVCSGGRGLMVWVSMSAARQTPVQLMANLTVAAFTLSSSRKTVIQLMDMANLTVAARTRVTEQPENSPFSLVNVDEHSGVAASGLPNLQRLSRERVVSERNQGVDQISIFAKGKLRSCVAKSSSRKSTIIPSILHNQGSAQETVSKLSLPDQFTIKHSSPLVSMDMSSSGEIFAVVDTLHRLYLYQRGATKPFFAFPANKSNTDVKVADVCFYKFEEREYLLVADSQQKDVTVLDMRRDYRVLGPLIHNSGQLRHPLALNVDPHTGLLLVLCRPGPPGTQERLVVCGTTCAPVERKVE